MKEKINMTFLAYLRNSAVTITVFVLISFSWSTAHAHNVIPGDAGYIQEIWGVLIVPFMSLGAKHMVTGYDHIDYQEIICSK